MKLKTIKEPENCANCKHMVALRENGGRCRVYNIVIPEPITTVCEDGKFKSRTDKEN